MMKWNSAKTYTENDMALMQQEAVNRVRDFQTRARSAGAFFEQPERLEYSSESSGEFDAYEAESLDADFSAQSQETFSDFGAESSEADFSAQSQETFETPLIEAQSRVVDGYAQSPAPALPSDPIHGLLDRLGVDSETLLILGLMFLLYNEKADNVLLLALAYLLI